MLSLDWRLACNARAGHPAQTFVMVASPLAIVASPLAMVASPLAMVAAPSVIVASPVHFIATAYPYTPHTLLEMTSFFWESGIRYLPCFFPSLFYVYCITLMVPGDRLFCAMLSVQKRWPWYASTL
jgi:hypothetical protein